MFNWYLEGHKVRGSYFGEFDVTGTVTNSRVKYGGAVSHHVSLDVKVKINGTVRDSVMMNQNEIMEIDGESVKWTDQGFVKN
jgi:hypothetical protein